MTATGKRFTADTGENPFEGVLFLTAGFGTRAEPLSFARPKCLLPYRDATIIGHLARQFVMLGECRMLLNASRCPDMILRASGCPNAEVLFEERPLGVSATLARHAELLKGTWFLCNTDFIMDLPLAAMLERHRESRASWTVLTCSFPSVGDYGALEVDGELRHYAGVSLIEPQVARCALEEQVTGGLFTDLREALEERGVTISEYFTERRWLDMGSVEHYRRNALNGGSFVHPDSSVSEEAVLKGFYMTGARCIIHDGALVRNSVVLDGAELFSGVSVTDTVVPWYTRETV